MKKSNQTTESLYLLTRNIKKYILQIRQISKKSSNFQPIMKVSRPEYAGPESPQRLLAVALSPSLILK